MHEGGLSLDQIMYTKTVVSIPNVNFIKASYFYSYIVTVATIACT